MPATVTLDFTRARNVRCDRAAREVGGLKRQAHHRARRAVRDWLRVGDLDDPPVVRPTTGWDVA